MRMRSFLIRRHSPGCCCARARSSSTSFVTPSCVFLSLIKFLLFCVFGWSVHVQLRLLGGWRFWLSVLKFKVKSFIEVHKGGMGGRVKRLTFNDG